MAYGEMKEASSRHREGKKSLHHIRIHKAENGGHTIEHHYDESGIGAYHPPETHVFGPKDGDALLDHVKKHMAVKCEGAKEEGKEEAKEGE